MMLKTANQETQIIKIEISVQLQAKIVFQMERIKIAIAQTEIMIRVQISRIMEQVKIMSEIKTMSE